MPRTDLDLEIRGMAVTCQRLAIYIYNYMRRESCHHSDVVIAYQSVNKSYIYILNVVLLFHCFLSITV